MTAQGTSSAVFNFNDIVSGMIEPAKGKYMERRKRFA